jgi:ABC-2 type transport system permease protein
LFYEVPFRGTWWALGLVTACFLTSALGQGLLISTLSKNQFVAAQASMVTAFLPAYMLSGFIFEIASMPAPIRFLTYLLTPRYFVTSLQTLFLTGNIWSLIIANIIPMVIIGTLFFLITAMFTKKRLD